MTQLEWPEKKDERGEKTDCNVFYARGWNDAIKHCLAEIRRYYVLKSEVKRPTADELYECLTLTNGVRDTTDGDRRKFATAIHALIAFGIEKSLEERIETVISGYAGNKGIDSADIDKIISFVREYDAKENK